MIETRRTTTAKKGYTYRERQRSSISYACDLLWYVLEGRLYFPFTHGASSCPFGSLVRREKKIFHLILFSLERILRLPFYICQYIRILSIWGKVKLSAPGR